MNWDGLDAGKYRNEADAISALLADVPLDPAERSAIELAAKDLVREVPEAKKPRTIAITSGGSPAAKVIENKAA